MKKVNLPKLQIPFIDIETPDQSKTPSQWKKIEQLQQTYAPFTGLKGVQVAQTLDQTSYQRGEDETSLHTKYHQVVYRWSKRKSKPNKSNNGRPEIRQPMILPNIIQRYSKAWPEHVNMDKTNSRNRLVKWFSSVVRYLLPAPSSQRRDPPTSDAEMQDLDGGSDPHPPDGTAGQHTNNPKAASVRLDNSRKWLVVRQLWLWKLADGESPTKQRKTRSEANSCASHRYNNRHDTV